MAIVLKRGGDNSGAVEEFLSGTKKVEEKIKVKKGVALNVPKESVAPKKKQEEVPTSEFLVAVRTMQLSREELYNLPCLTFDGITKEEVAATEWQAWFYAKSLYTEWPRVPVALGVTYDSPFLYWPKDFVVNASRLQFSAAGKDVSVRFAVAR